MDGRIRALILAGPPGVGKTTPIEKIIEEEDPDYDRTVIQSGYMRPPHLFRLLYKYRNPNNLVVLDDMDSVWNDMNSLNILKKATDTTKTRHLVYGSDYKLEDEETGEPIPKHFEFNGSVMFITNMNFNAAKRSIKLAPHIEAMESRSFIVDLGMKTKRHLLLRIYQVANLEGLFDPYGFNLEQKKEILDFITDNISSLREISLRTAVKCAQLMVSEGDSWTEMARVTMFR